MYKLCVQAVMFKGDKRVVTIILGWSREMVKKLSRLFPQNIMTMSLVGIELVNTNLYPGLLLSTCDCSSCLLCDQLYSC